LVFRYVVQPRQARLPTARDRAQVRAQMKFLHWLGFCHLDITPRNILLAHGDKCYLMDFDCVCEIGRAPLGPLPPESSDPILRRDPAEIEDDTHLWQLLQGDYFKHLPAEVDEDLVEVQQPQPQAQQQQPVQQQQQQPVLQQPAVIEEKKIPVSGVKPAVQGIQQAAG